MTATWYLVRAQRRHQDAEDLAALLLTVTRRLKYWDRRKSVVAERTEPALLDYSWVRTDHWAALGDQLGQLRLPPVHRLRNAIGATLIAPQAVVDDVRARAEAGEWDEDTTVGGKPALHRGDRVEVWVDSVGLVLGVVRYMTRGSVIVHTDWGPQIKAPLERVEPFEERGWRERHREAAAEEASPSLRRGEVRL